MKDLGGYLKVTRIEQGVSLEEAAEDMDLSVNQLESIEAGNVRAFKDVYKLKQYIKKYAKYLGLDSDKVIDEFNGFLFEHTSKISLEDIMEAKKKSEEDEQQKNNKVKSPYTKEYKKRIDFRPFIIVLVVLFIIILTIYLIVSEINKAPTRDSELKAVNKEICNEYTY